MVNFTGKKREVVAVSKESIRKKLSENAAVLSPEQFLEDFEREAAEAKERVIGQSLTFEAKRSGDVVTRIFAESTPKQVRRELVLDWFTILETDQQLTKLSFLNPFGRNRLLGDLNRKEELWAQMKRVGVELTFSNPPRNILESIFPVTGRNHMKAAGVDNQVFYIGGFNYGNLELDLADFMVKFAEPKVARELMKQWDRVNSRREVDDYQIKLDDDTELLVDGGQAGVSLIMNRAVKEVQESKAFVLAVTSGLFPNGEFAKELEVASKRGVKVENICGTIKVRHHWPISNIHLFWLVSKLNQLIFKWKKYSFPVLVSKKRGVHAKLLIIDGRVAIFGSHNFSDKGVMAGTKEWAVVTRNGKLIGNLIKFYENLRGEITEDN